MLKENLLRQGTDLAFETNLFYIDVNNHRLGVNTNIPSVGLDVNTIALFKNNLQINGANITTVNSNGNIDITPNGTGNVNVNGYLVASNFVTGGNLNTTGNANVGNLGTNTAIITTGNITTINSGLMQNGNSNVTIAANSDVSIYANGSSHRWTFAANGNMYTPESGQIRASSPFYGISVQDYSSNSYVSMDAVNTVVQGNALVRLRINGGTDFDFTNGLANIGAANLVTTGNANVSNVNVSGNANITTNLSVTGNSSLGNLKIYSNSIEALNANGNVVITPIGNGSVIMNTSTAIAMPIGDAGDRPSYATAGYFRYNNVNNCLEYYDGATWISIISSFNNFTSDTIDGDGSTLNFTLSQASSTGGVIVTINGVAQEPANAYSVSGTTLTFVEAPLEGDRIVARVVSSSTTVTELQDGTSSIILANSAPYARTTIRGANRLEVNNLNIVHTVGTVANVTAQSVDASAVKIDDWSPSSYSGAKYVVQVNNGTDRQLTELLVTGNSTTAYIANIGSINSGSALMTFSANISSGNVALWGTGTGTGNSVKVSRHLVV